MPSKADWSCDSCHANNFAEDASCRVCRRAPGSVTGVRQLVRHMELPLEPADRPQFVQSKHEVLPEPAVTLAPKPEPRPAVVSPPAGPGSRARPADPGWRPGAARPGPPPVPRRPAGAGRIIGRTVVVLVAGIMAISAITTLYRIGHSLVNSVGHSPPPAACPAAAAQWLPASGSGSELVVRYETDKHVITVCRDGAGQYHYDGQIKGAPATTENHISLSATETGTGFTADNGEYHYEIDGMQLTVERGAKVLSRTQLTRVAP